MLRHPNRPFEADLLVGAVTPLSMCNSPDMKLIWINDIVPGESDEHRMLDIVVRGIAVADAIQRQLGGVGQEFAQIGVR